jgi:hypothetical protein
MAQLPIDQAPAAAIVTEASWNEGKNLGARAKPAKFERNQAMHITVVTLQPLIALIFGVLVLLAPRILNYLIAVYLILVGLFGLFPNFITRLMG